jgi:hypothetical protein
MSSGGYVYDYCTGILTFFYFLIYIMKTTIPIQHILLLTIALLCANVLFAQNNISGKVIDSTTQRAA